MSSFPYFFTLSKTFLRKEKFQVVIKTIFSVKFVGKLAIMPTMSNFSNFSFPKKGTSLAICASHVVFLFYLYTQKIIVQFYEIMLMENIGPVTTITDHIFIANLEFSA